jgi:PIN domain nuclease of toxin-antitoxin system
MIQINNQDGESSLQMWYDSGMLKQIDISDPTNSLFISVVSIWEILVKNKLGKLPLPAPLSEILKPIRAASNLQMLPLRESAVYRLIELPGFHRDPFDRILICQAIDEGLSIVTPDAQVRSYPVPTIW